MKVKDCFELLVPLGEFPVGSIMKYLGEDKATKKYHFSVIQSEKVNDNYVGVIIAIPKKSFDIIDKGVGTVVKQVNYTTPTNFKKEDNE